jgi:hypothetical protein
VQLQWQRQLMFIVAEVKSIIPFQELLLGTMELRHVLLAKRYRMLGMFLRHSEVRTTQFQKHAQQVEGT